MTRDRTAMFVRRGVERLREAALDVELAAERGTATGLQRPAFYRERAEEAVAGLVAITRGMATVIELLTNFAELYPAAHDDDLDVAGRCACGRPVEACPARAAAEAGEREWVDEDGASHPISEAATRPATDEETVDTPE